MLIFSYNYSYLNICVSFVLYGMFSHIVFHLDFAQMSHMLSIQVAEWLVILISDLEVQVGIPLENEFSSWSYDASLLRVFYYYPSIISIWLKLCRKGCKTTNHYQAYLSYWSYSFLLFYMIMTNSLVPPPVESRSRAYNVWPWCYVCSCLCHIRNQSQTNV